MICRRRGPNRQTRIGFIVLCLFFLVLWGSLRGYSQPVSSQSTTGDQSPAIVAGGNVTIVYHAPPERSKPDISLGVALYTYEKAFVLKEQTKTYYMEMRNLVPIVVSIEEKQKTYHEVAQKFLRQVLG